jgi:hypothetical protein
MSIRQTITAIFKDVASEQGKRLPALADDVPLLNMDLDSLCMAIIVARLEGSLDMDPFSATDDVTMPSTFGEFVALYENAAV